MIVYSFSVHVFIVALPKKNACDVMPSRVKIFTKSPFRQTGSRYSTDLKAGENVQLMSKSHTKYQIIWTSRSREKCDKKFLWTNGRTDKVIVVCDVATPYQIPLTYHKQFQLN